ncbi:MaoC domain protein dehydratase [Alkalihalophilus pseudofirmus OF4]|uniref:MaoC domain protein dehydratase n=1 Tax=Alkalihalophilus pseudofirmus (strain ATCC BAA-2126 / JCM 17055 / OF4) TaxID=398511 RepID=D3FXX6_ALKPO|nr:MaoC family dehydratase [Alkalihalophilus pseudofirmus]ADC50735.1 MaoC domain protein dehydratase [Alkalihalophilus pseudofirmus OF4]
MKVGDKKHYTRTISESDNYLFGGIIGDSNPWHFDEEFCKKTKFETRIAYGMLSSSYFATIFSKMFDKPVLYLSQNIEFLKPVKLNDTVTAECEIKQINGDKVTLLTSAFNQAGDKVISGEAKLLVIEDIENWGKNK